MTTGQGQVLADDMSRIADALERIADNMEALAECIVYVPPTPQQVTGFHFIRIGGSVDTE